MKCSEPGCKSKMGKEEWNGYCPPHAVKHGIIPPLRRSGGKKTKKNLLDHLKNSGMRTTLKYIQGLIRKESSFSAEDTYYSLKESNLVPGDKYGAAKVVYSMWLLSYGLARSPGTEQELSELFGVPTTLLGRWKHSSWMTDMFCDELDRNMVRFRKIVDLILFANAVNGDKQSQELFYKRFDTITKNRRMGEKVRGINKKSKMGIGDGERTIEVSEKLNFGIEYEGDDKDGEEGGPPKDLLLPGKGDPTGTVGARRFMSEIRDKVDVMGEVFDENDDDYAVVEKLNVGG